MSNICIWTDEDTDDNVQGSGAEQWPWYLTGIDFDAATGEYVVEMEDPDGDGAATKVYRFTRGKVRSTMTAMAMGKLPVNDTIRSYAQNDNNDACSMDCAIQWITYGEIIFG